MNTCPKLALRSFPSRIADLGFVAELPADWVAHDFPAEPIDLSSPTTFVPLAVLTAPYAALIFSFAARPAYEDGSLQDWAWYHLNHNQLQPRAVGRQIVANVSAVVGEAVQQSEIGPLMVRFAFLEDGDRLLNLTLTAPEPLADSVREAWFAMLRSFKLETARGSRFKIAPHPDDIPAAPLPEPWVAWEQASVSENLNARDEGKEVQQHDERNTEVPEDQAAPPPPDSKFGDFALAADAASLDPENSINASLRSRGVGLVPNVVATNHQHRRATLAAGAIMAQFDVPFGWHVIDDGKRTLVFEPTGKVQINLDLIVREGRTNQDILDAIESEMRIAYPQPEFVRIDSGRIHALGARNIADGDQPLEQYHMLFPFRESSKVLRARVTSVPDQARAARNLAELILESCVFDAAQTPAENRQEGARPSWWVKALELESEDQLEAAEKMIREECPHIGFAASSAEMYRQRMLRLKAKGDREGALRAFQKASDFIFYYASMATSGGEGAALSLVRDEFRARLVAEFGSDPDLVHV